MMKKLPFFSLIFLFSSVVLLSCSTETEGTQEPKQTGWKWDLPSGVPEPPVPADNPMSQIKVKLGRYLFYDHKLSDNQSFGCGTCHAHNLAFTDARTTSVGSTGEIHPRNSMNLTNVAYATHLNWSNPLTTTLEQQAITPMFGDAPRELALTSIDTLLDRLKADPEYVKMFKEAFPERNGEISLDTTLKAISAFERTFLSFNSPYDKYKRGDDNAISASAKRGLKLFFSERLKCFHCHSGFNFTDSSFQAGESVRQTPFHNNGLYSLDAKGSYPIGNQGIYEFTGDMKDMGQFKAPTLRNIEVTAPYMHDGSVATLEEVIDSYARGGFLTTSGPNKGDGAKNPHKSIFIQGFTITAQEKQDLIEFLKSLTDKDFLLNPDLDNPFVTP